MLGSSPVAEAFWIAFSLPNMFRRFFAEGAFNMAFIPLYAKKLEAGEGADEFARDAFSGMFALLAIFSVIGIVFMPGLVWLMASGFAEDGRFDIAVIYGRIAFPYIMLISLAALLSGLLNANRRFLAAAAAPVLLNVVFLVSIGIALLLDISTSYELGRSLAWAVPVGGFAQLALVYVAAWRAGHRLTLRVPRLTPELKRLAVIAAPAALAGGVVQINLLVGRQVASYFDGAIVWLSLADRLYQLPLGVVGIAIGVVLLPELSRRLRAGDAAGEKEAFSRSCEFALLLTLPAAVALATIPLPLIQVLFEGQAFTADDTAATALALMVYALGLPAFVMQKALQPLYFAREDTTSPLRYALVSLVVNAAIAVGLMGTLGFVAAAIGTTVAGWAMVVLLWVGRKKMGAAAEFDAQLKRRIWRIIFASVIMGAALWGLQIALGPMFARAGADILGLVILVIGGTVIYFVTAQFVGAMRIQELRAAMRRRPSGDEASS